MAMIKHPFKRGQFIRVNDNYDNQDIIVENALSQNKQFTDLPKVAQLTQNSWNMSPYTREDVYKDVTIVEGARVGRHDRFKGLIKGDYRD